MKTIDCTYKSENMRTVILILMVLVGVSQGKFSVQETKKKPSCHNVLHWHDCNKEKVDFDFARAS